MAQAIAEAIADTGRSQADVARALGRTPAWLNRIVNGERGIKSPDLERLADELGVQVSDFYDRGVRPRRVAEGNASYLPGPLVAIPVVDQEASASLRGGMVVDQVFIDRAAAPAPDRLVGVRVRGNCLAPDIVDGDIVVVDTSMSAEPGNPVVALVDGELHVKRYWIKGSGKHVLKSNEGEVEIEPWQIEGVVVSLHRQMEKRRR